VQTLCAPPAPRPSGTEMQVKAEAPSQTATVQMTTAGIPRTGRTDRPIPTGAKHGSRAVLVRLPAAGPADPSPLRGGLPRLDQPSRRLPSPYDHRTQADDDGTLPDVVWLDDGFCCHSWRTSCSLGVTAE
jgi:hypothetical protein